MYLAGSIFQINAQLINAQEREGTLMVEVSFEKDNYSIERAWILKEDFPAFSAFGKMPNDLVFHLADIRNNEIKKVRIRNPRIVRVPLMPQDSSENSLKSKNEHFKYVKEGTFLLRFPYYKNVRYVNLLGFSTIEVGNGRSNSPVKKNEKVVFQMDLLQHLNN